MTSKTNEPTSRRRSKVAIALIVAGLAWVAVNVPITQSQPWAFPGVVATGAGASLLWRWIAGGGR